MNELMKEFREDLADFRDMTDKFYAKEVSVAEYKGFSGGFGSYAQRGGEKSMLRLRIPGGRLTKEKLKFVCDIQGLQLLKNHLIMKQLLDLE